MVTSGTYTFGPSTGELVLEAFRWCGKRPPELVADDFVSARMSVGLVLSNWANKGVNLWLVDQVTVPMVPGQATYSLDPWTIDLLDGFISTLNEDGTTQDLTATPLGRTEFAAIPEKEQRGRPINFWFDRTMTPQVTMWPIPDSTQAYNFVFYRFRQAQDAPLENGVTPEVQQRFLFAFVADVAAKLAIKHAPPLAAQLTALAEDAWQEASQEDREKVPLYITPDLGGYFR